MKTSLRTIFLIFFTGFLHTFGEVINTTDSLRRVLSKKMADTSRVLLLEQIAKDLWNSDLENALGFAQEGLSLSEKIQFKKGESRCLNRIGAIESRLGNHQKAISTLFKSINIAREIEDKEGLARANINLGIIYGEQLDHRKALDCYNVALELSKKIKNESLYNLALLNIGAEYVPMKMYDSAQYFTQKSYEIALRNNSEEIDIMLYNLGNIFSEKKDNIKALEYFKKSKSYSEKINNQRFLSQSLYMIGKSYQKLSKDDSSKFYAEKSNLLAQQTSNLELIMRSYLLLSTLSEKTDPKLALAYYKKAETAKDSLYNYDKNLQIQKLTFQQNLHEKDLMFATKDFKNKQILSIVSSILGILLVISIALFVINKNKTKAHDVLAAQKKEIEAQKGELDLSLETLKQTQKQLILQEKLASLGELTAGIAHEIQNPLNFVNNFSEVSIEIVEELADAIKESSLRDDTIVLELLEGLTLNQEKINTHGKRASSIVKNMLEHSRGSKSETSQIDINKIAEEYLHLSYHGMRAKDKEFNASFELNLDKSIPHITGMKGDIGRVFLNIINNAFYAVNERKKKNEVGYKPMVSVSTVSKTNEGIVEIRIEDNGVGIPAEIKDKIFQPFFTTKPSGHGTGLGLSLSREIIVNGHNGTLEVEKNKVGGTTFIIQFAEN